MKNVSTSKLLLDKPEFLDKYVRYFEITGGRHPMEGFIWLELEQSKSKISLHLHNYI